MSFTAVGSNNQTVWGAKNDQFYGTEREWTGDFTNAGYDLVYAPDSVTNEKPGASLKISGTDLLSGVSYYIVNKNSNLSLDLPNGSTANGTNIQQWDQNGCFAQQFRIIAEKDGWCRIASVGDESKVISVAYNTAADGTNVELSTYKGADNQLFDTNVPVRQLLEQIVSKLSIPPFLLGLNWSTTERMSSQQADILTSELEYYRRLLTPVLCEIGDSYLCSVGADAVCRAEWDNINLQDESALAEARLKNAQAQEIELRNQEKLNS